MNVTRVPSVPSVFDSDNATLGFSDLRVLVDMMEEGVLLCRGLSQPLYANAAALVLVPESADPLADLIELLPPESRLLARRHGRWSGDLNFEDGRILQVRVYFY
ncbi:MAG TPA: hypothetical protein VK325_03430, partial [Pseudoxanthomonas sp.]|nr:hypothetical protein [Pseudoxanthomonas sp.]